MDFKDNSRNSVYTVSQWIDIARDEMQAYLRLTRHPLVRFKIYRLPGNLVQDTNAYLLYISPKENYPRIAQFRQTHLTTYEIAR